MNGARLTASAAGLLAAALSFWPMAVEAHSERPTHAPDGTGHVPAYRTAGPRMIVCKDDKADFEQRIATFPPALQQENRDLFALCRQNGYRDLQAAVDHVTAGGTTILVLPGLYQEGPSLAPQPDACNHLQAQVVPAGYQILSYEQQKECPHQQNLVGIFGIKDLQIEGTGAAPTDVVFDAEFQKLNVIRGDRTNGLYLRNLTAERSTFNAVYVIETDGFVVDRVLGRWNTEYGFLSFAADHGLFKGCEAYGNGDSGIYPGGTSDVNRDRGFDVPRYAIEVTGCHSHDNLLGYSGTGGDSVWVHDNEFDHNTGGASMDSLFPNHPGLPQNHALFERNLIHGNNSNYYPLVTDGTCGRPYAQRGIERGAVCPAVPVPVGSGVLVIGGNYDVFRDNVVYDNWKVGFVQIWVPGLVRNDFDWSAQWETSHFDRYLNNRMGTRPDGTRMPNGVDYFWDGEGTGNCWQLASGSTVEPLVMPACPAGSVHKYLGDPNLLLLSLDCSNYDLPTRNLPAGCDWFQTPPRPAQTAAWFNAKAVAPALQILLVMVLLTVMLRRRPRGSALKAITLAAAAVGSVVLLLGAGEQLYAVAPAGIAILGAAWLAAAFQAPSRGLSVLSAALGLAALLEAIDAGIVMLALPVAVVWLRIALELVWIAWLAIAVIRRRPSRGADASIMAREDEPAKQPVTASI